MTSTEQKAVEPDLERIRLLLEPVSEFREFFETKSQLKKVQLFFKHQFRSFYFVSPPPWRIVLRKRNNKQRVIPDFCSTGAIRSGTTTLSTYIFQHPCVVLPIAKELSAQQLKSDFVQAQFPTQKAVDKTLERYGVAKCGYASPFSPSATVTFFQKHMNPDIKTVVILRNPVDRAISHWCWDLMRTKELKKDPVWKYVPDFEETMEIEMREIPQGGTGFQAFSGAGSTSYLRHSIYTPFLELLFAEMGRENVHVVIANEFFKAPDEQIQEVYEFLGLPKYNPVEIKEFNPCPKIEVSDEFKQKLSVFFRPYNEQLYALLGRDLHWK